MAAVVAAIVGLFPGDVPADEPRLAIVIGPQAPELERFAAGQLKSILERLYTLQVEIATKATAASNVQIVLGQRTTNPLLRDAPRPADGLSDQGLLLRTVAGPTPRLFVEGGSPAATLWATYELGERLGARYLHDRDVYPVQSAWPGLPELDVVMEPDLAIRCWRLVNEHAMGPVSWSLRENRRFLRQMAKMKFNRVRVQLWPAQPFVQYTLRGMAKPKGTIYFGHHFPIDDDTIGKGKLGSGAEFTNPEFVGAESADELHRRAVRLVRGIFDEARQLGMETALAFVPAEWPKEFQAVLPGTQIVDMDGGSLTIEPGPNQSIDDPLLREATATVIRAYVQTYPEVDYLILSMPEHGHWAGQAQEAYRRLIAAHNVRGVDEFAALCAQARNRTTYPGGGARVERQLKSDLSSLWFLDSLVREQGLLKRPGGGPDIKLIYDGLVDELVPLVAHVAPPGSQTVSFIDYTASRQLARRDLIERVPPKDVPAALIFTLADDNVGVLPQLATGSLDELMRLLRKHRWAGFYTRYWTIGELDPAIHFLARGSWDASLTPRQAYADQVGHVCGPDAVEPALTAFAIVEQITLRLDQHGLGLGFPVPDMMTKHFQAGGLPKDILQDRESYREALRLIERAHAICRPEGRDYTRYFVNRLRFAVRYLDAAESFGGASLALKEGRNREALDRIDVACAAIREALEAYALVARDHGDLGSIAVMNEYCYRPIRDKRNEIRVIAAGR
ncbi:MAG: hypothetical protein HYX69_05015 [Planctomycetia bacterium]|nr:hypothetical protein [Planctomycetia bacterium]